MGLWTVHGSRVEMALDDYTIAIHVLAFLLEVASIFSNLYFYNFSSQVRHNTTSN